MDRLLKNPVTIISFILPAFILYLAIVIVPLLISGYFSTLDWNGVSQPVFVGLDNYAQILGNNATGFPQSLVNTLILTVLTLLIQIPLAIVLALILAREIRGEAVFRTVFFIPVILSSVVIALLWRRIYDPNFGLLNALLQGLGFIKAPVAWLGDDATVLLSICAPIVWQWIGYHMLLIYAGAKNVPKELYEAALIDGASEFTIARRITLPLIAPVIRICVVLAVIGSVKTFDLIWIFTGGNPTPATEVPSTLMVNTLFKKMAYGEGSAIAIMIVVLCLLLTVAIQRLARTKEITY